MKFAKELEQDLVPEWRAKYLDYKTGKKYVKNIARAVAKANGTPRILDRDTFFPRKNNYQPVKNRYDGNDETSPTEPLRELPVASRPGSRQESEDSSGDQQATTPMLIPGRKKRKEDDHDEMQYGSFIPTPPSPAHAHLLKLPGPAISPELGVQFPPNGATPSVKSATATHPSPLKGQFQPPRRSYSVAMTGSAYEVGQNKSPAYRYHTFGPTKTGNTHQPERQMSLPGGPVEDTSRGLLRSMFPSNSPRADLNLPVLDQVKSRQQEFFQWMDSELDKIETFYKSKEDEAGHRLEMLRKQLHVLRNRRIDELAEARKSISSRKDDEHIDSLDRGHEEHDLTGGNQPRPRLSIHTWMQPIEKAIHDVTVRTRGPHPGPNSRALERMDRTPELVTQHVREHVHVENGRDYVRRPYFDHEISYRSAKKKLKLGLKEYYRSLELLKSYALLNTTAFRKINKKYDKAVDAHPPLRYMSEKVKKAWFVKSDVLDHYILAVEDLYSRYFERGHHKVAVGKLRSAAGRPLEHAGSTFRSGLFIGIGAIFTIQGLIDAVNLLSDNSNPVMQLRTNYLLQIYAGYLLALYLFAWFCLDCAIWTQNKINYVFVFEFDARHHLDWREMIEFPAFFLMLLGLFLWLNFSGYAVSAIFLYFPAILIFISIVIICFPAPILFHRSRRWFLYAHWRLLLAGLYPVEFRDFFLGDMYCSLTYCTSNIEMFFCVYADHWNNPAQCNSTHSRLLGFFSTLPGIWRALQCIRRYHDSGKVFPHLLNCGKYAMTIMYYVTLSLYRIEEDDSLLALFITFATINALYCSTWDLAMDWSLCQSGANKPFLRNVRGYKPTWPYYVAMIIDPLLRFNWVFYVIYTHDLQHSSIASFLIAFSEISRRGMWTIFRVENEHCANVAHFKASRDIPLPYPLSPDMESDTFAGQHPTSESPEVGSMTMHTSPAMSRHRSRTTAAEEGEDSAGPSSGLRRRAPTRTLTTMVAEAHTQDFEKKRKPGATSSDHANSLSRQRTVSDDDDNGVSSDDEDDEEDRMNLREAKTLEGNRNTHEE